jgi:hypothetical protein
MGSLRPMAMLLLLLASGTSALGEELGLANTEYILTEEDSPLVLTSLYLAQNGIMRLEPGARLVIAPTGYGGGIEIRGGRLIAEGTPEKPARIEIGSVTNESSIWLSPHHSERRALSLEHTIWDMGPSRMVISSEGDGSETVPLVSIRNSILISTASRDYYHDAMFVLEGGGIEPIVFESTLFSSSTNAALRLIATNRPVEMRRCVFTAGPYPQSLSAINIGQFPSPYPAWIDSALLLEDCRFSGFESAIRVGMLSSDEEVQLAITIRGSDFSTSGLLARVDSTDTPLEFHVEDSHVAPVHFGLVEEPRAQLSFLRSYIAEGEDFSNAPVVTTVNNPLDHSPFRSADINSDGIVNHNDLRILMDVISGALDVEELDDPGMLDMDGDGGIGLRDLAVLQAYAEGTLNFLPVEEVP